MIHTQRSDSTPFPSLNSGTVRCHSHSDLALRTLHHAHSIRLSSSSGLATVPTRRTGSTMSQSERSAITASVHQAFSVKLISNYLHVPRIPSWNTRLVTASPSVSRCTCVGWVNIKNVIFLLPCTFFLGKASDKLYTLMEGVTCHLSWKQQTHHPSTSSSARTSRTKSQIEIL